MRPAPPNKPEAKKPWFLAAQRHLSQAIKLDPLYEVAYLNLADAEFALMPLAETKEARLRHAQGVIEAVDKAKQVADMRGGALTGARYRQRLLAHSEVGRAGDALVMIVELIKQVPDMRRQLVIDAGTVAMAAHGRGDEKLPAILKTAAQVMDVGIGAQPRPPAQLLLLRGEVAAARGNTEAAIRVLRLGLERGPSPKHQKLLDELIQKAGPEQGN